MRIWGAIIYILILPFSIKANEINITIVPQKYTYEPGTNTTIPIILINKENHKVTYELTTYSQSNKILLLNAKKIIEIQPQQKENILLPISITKDCNYGEHIITLKIVDNKSTSYQLFDLKINVTKNEQFTLNTLNSVDYVKAGDTINSDFTIKNTGNTKQTIIVKSNHGTILGNNTVNLKPQEEKIVRVYKITNPKEAKENNQLLDVTINGRNTENKLSAFTNTKIIPINPQTMDAYKRLPIQLSLNYINMRQQNKSQHGFQGELYLNTSLNKRNNDLLEMKIISKNPIEQYYYTKYDEYYATYSNKDIYIHIGDKVYSSSYLTEYARYGKGVEVQYKIGKFGLSGFYNKPRFFKNIEDEFNIKSNYAINKSNTLSIGYLQKRQTKNSSTHLPYVIYTTNIIKHTAIEFEYAYSKHSKLDGSAYRIDLNTKLKKFNGRINYSYSSPNFRGYFANTTNINSALNYTISSKINAFLTHSQNEKNRQRDTLFFEAPLFKQTQFGIDYNYAKKGKITLFNGYMKNEDRLTKSLFKYEELFTKININQQLGPIQLDINNHFGYTKNNLSNKKGKSSIQQVSLSIYKYNANLMIYGSMYNTSRYDYSNQKNFYYGGRLNKIFSKSTMANIFYQSNYIPEEYYADRNQFEGSVIQNIGNNHALELSGRYLIQRGEIGDKDLIVSLKYKALLNVPIKKIITYTSLTGHISDNSKGLKAIRVQLGNNYAITDKDGNYTFKNIVPGDYYLDIDRSTLSIDAISRISLPKAITIVGENLNQQNFEITKAAVIKGNIKYNDYLNPNSLSTDLETILSTNIIIEATDGNKTLRRIARINTSFDFTYLQPGSWKIKIYANSLNKNLKIATDTFEFMLVPSELKQIQIEIKANQKEIFYQQEPINVGYIGAK